MTDEHIWGDWTKAYVPRISNKHDFAEVRIATPGTHDPPEVRIKAGDPLNSTVRVVCAACNSGWLSQIQERAKPFLIPLFEGKATILDVETQAAISTWISMATMTSEYISRKVKRVGVAQTERDRFMREQVPHPDWRIWIGNYAGTGWNRQWAHAAFPILNTENLPSIAPDDAWLPNVHTTTFKVGALYVSVMGGDYATIIRGWDWRTAPRARTLLRQIWPFGRRNTIWPVGDMTDADAEDFATAFLRYSDDLALRAGYTPLKHDNAKSSKNTDAI
jgi:hypothetical protein